MNRLLLDRRIITGEIDNDTPNCVLVDFTSGNRLIEAQSYPHHYLLKYALESKNDLNIIDLSLDNILQGDKSMIMQFANKIAAFVNPNQKVFWSLSGLFEAFKHMLFFELKLQEDFLNDVAIGPKTMESKFSYNACMLYRICKANNIRTKPSMNINQMAQCVKIICEIKNKRITIPKCIKYYYPSLSKKDLIPIFIELVYKSSANNQCNTTVSYENLSYHYSNLSNINKLLNRIMFESGDEAIMAVAMKYGLDVTYSSNPLQEFNTLVKAEKEKKEYIPFDRNFAILYKRNPKWFSYRLNYSPMLSMFYDVKTLTDFVRKEMFSDEETKVINASVRSYIQDKNDKKIQEILKSSLYECRIGNTFYLGCHPKVNNPNSTPIELEDVDDKEVDINCLITYGSIECEELTVYKTSELRDYFNNSKNFSDPMKPNENFTPRSIRKLKNICETITGAGEVKNAKDHNYGIAGTLLKSLIVYPKVVSNASLKSFQITEFKLLLESIINVEKEQYALNAQAEKLLKIYKSSSIPMKNSIKSTLNKLLDIGMYMRGWKVSCDEKTLPLRSEKTSTPPGRENEVIDLVNHSIHLFRESFSELGNDIETLIKNLTLVRYQITNNTIEFKQSNHKDGLTIWDRIIIVIQGNETNNVAACIRMTSNWLVSSAYYYLSILGVPKTFDISQLSLIS